MNRIGLIVNPVAGLGGRVGLKGSDGLAIQRKAVELGGQPHAGERAAQALQVLLPLASQFKLLTYPSTMGAEAAEQAGIHPHVLGFIKPGQTSAEDTARAAGEMVGKKVGLILFTGGDGTAREGCGELHLRGSLRRVGRGDLAGSDVIGWRTAAVAASRSPRAR